MKNVLLSTLLTGMACCAGSVFAASNGEGQINFTGEILDSACEVVNSAASPLSVTLGKVSKSSFSTVGATSAPTTFDIELKNCPESITSTSITFGGTADANNNDVLALKAETGAATGIGVQLLDASSQPLSLYTASADYALTSGATTNKLTFGARYIATAATVTAGLANAVSTFTVVYN
ncbi:fimbrial protein [Cronobacter dublinensis]|uniref:fimbrial protein n=2 Tax=Cronobacter TaxID=413496 RepID=UPI000CFC90AB|nr:fimbrial protein [Cronobacter dublinensis]EGT4380522.1 type 1 fimbrial protein [Cronobacter dublinensis]EKP4476763.1 fimbrial protein [Cronobacter dublinensis]EKY3222143.1 fimbrial protein [Cronobacter dublinensis]EKY3243646.1 fimbrial protein [Cronobacter dublinensis]ELY4003114.1 fimbrial protein [Cronobacter dublinensis]